MQTANSFLEIFSETADPRYAPKDSSLWSIANACTTEADVLDTTRTNYIKDDTQKIYDLSTVSRRTLPSHR